MTTKMSPVISFSWADWLPPMDESPKASGVISNSIKRPWADTDNWSSPSSTSLSTLAEDCHSLLDMLPSLLVEDEDSSLVHGHYPAAGVRSTPRRQVHFASTIEVREYGLVLGDHPWPDSYPLQLDWAHTESTFTVPRQPSRSWTSETIPTDNSSCTSSSSSTFRKPHRLSALERRWRLAIVTGKTQVQIDQEEEQRRRNTGCSRDNLPTCDRDDKKYMGLLLRTRTLHDLQGDSVAHSL